MDPIAVMSLKDAAAFAYDGKGIIVTLEPDDASRAALAALAGHDAVEIHMTLAHLGKTTDQPPVDLALVLGVLFSHASFGPQFGSIGGFGFLGSDGFAGNTVALIDVPDLAELRTCLVTALTEAGVAVGDHHDFIPHICVAQGQPVFDAPEAVGTSITFDAIGLRSAGQRALVPLDPPEPEVEPVLEPEPDPIAAPAPSGESPMSTTDTFATADELAPGAPVAWMDGDVERTGIVIQTITAEDGTITVQIAPDDAPDSPVELPIDGVTVTVAADPALEPDAEVVEDVVPEDVVEPEDDLEPEDVVEADDNPWLIVPGHLACVGPEGTVAVVAVDGDGLEIGVDSCHMDEAAAQARIDELLAADALEDVAEDDDVDEDVEMRTSLGTVYVGVQPRGMDLLDAAAERAREIRETLALLNSLSPEFASTLAPTSTATGPLVFETITPMLEPAPAIEPIVVRTAEELLAAMGVEPTDGAAEFVEAALSEEPSLADVPQEDLIKELARRFADSIAADVAASDPVDASAEGDAAAADSEPVVDDAVTAADGDPDPVVEDEGVAPTVLDIAEYEWEGVLIVEGIPSGDGRQIAENALTWRELPIPLMLQTVNAQGHDGSVICGSIHAIERVGQNIMGYGMFDSGEAGQEAKRLLTEGTMRGVSADIDSVVVEFLTEDGTEISMEDLIFGGVEALEVLVAGRIMGATLTPFPAFQEAHVTVIASADAEADVALVAAGGSAGDVWRVPSPIGVWMSDSPRDPAAALGALVASAAATVEVPVNPPRAWFEPGAMAAPEPFTVHPDGRCYGLVARFGTCHIGFSKKCVEVPRSGSAYRSFRNKSCLTAEGDLVATGPIFMDTVHPSLRLIASDAQAHYAHTGCAVADVALYENEWGIVAAGSLRPGLTPEQVRVFRGSDVSPDWREIGGRLEVVGLLSVNVSGFIVDSLVASGAELPTARGLYDSVSGNVTALVAAGMVRKEDLADEALEARFAEIATAVDTLGGIVNRFVLQPALEALDAEADAEAVAEESAVVEASIDDVQPDGPIVDRAAALEQAAAKFGIKTTRQRAEEAAAKFGLNLPAKGAGVACEGDCGCGGSCGVTTSTLATGGVVDASGIALVGESGAETVVAAGSKADADPLG